MIALTDIKIGKGEDEEDLYFAAGEEVKGLDKKTLEELKTSGAVGEKSTFETRAADADKIAQLEAELARVTLERDNALRNGALDPGQTGEAALRLHGQDNPDELEKIQTESEQNTSGQGSTEKK